LWTLRVERAPARIQREKIHRVRDQVRRFEGKPVYVTHWFWNTEVGFFMRFEDAYFPSGYDPYHAVRIAAADKTSLNRYVQTLEPGAAIGPGLLVHDEKLFAISQGERESWSVGRGEIPPVLSRIPEGWKLLDRVDLGERFAAALYEIPEGSVWPSNQ